MMPTKREVIAELRGEIAMYRDSYTSRSTGKITDTEVIHTIRCLEVALLCVQRTKFPNRKRVRP